MKALIVDDERLARLELSKLIALYPDVQLVGEASNADEALQKVQELKPDVLFLDINMPEKSGFDLLQEMEKPPAVIFVTAYDEFAIKAFENNALDYVLKPVDPERLKEAIEKLRRVLDTRKSSIYGQTLREEDLVFVKDGEKCWYIKLGDIRYFESVGNYARVHFNNDRPLIHRSLNALEDRLDPTSFFRANRQEIINLKFIEKIEPYFSNSYLVTLKGGKTIEVSRRQAQKFRENFSL